MGGARSVADERYEVRVTERTVAGLPIPLLEVVARPRRSARTPTRTE